MSTWRIYEIGGAVSATTPPATTTRQQHFEGQSTGTSVSIANSTTYGDAAASTVLGTGGTVTYSGATSAHGVNSVALNMTAGGTTSVLGVGLAGSSMTQPGARYSALFGALPSAPTRVLQLLTAGGADLGGLTLNANGTISVISVTGTVLNTSSSTTQVIDPTAWYRLEMVWNISATLGSYKAAVYVGDSTSPWYSYTSATNLATGTTAAGEVRFGKLTSASVISSAWYIDDTAVNTSTTTFIGPYLATGPAASWSIAPGFAKLDARTSTPANSGTLSYAVSPSTNVVQSPVGVFYIPQSSANTTYTLTVTEFGGGSTVRAITIPGLSSASSSQTTVMTQRYLGSAWV